MKTEGLWTRVRSKCSFLIFYIWIKIKVLFNFKSLSLVSSFINEIHIFVFPSKHSFRFPFHSDFRSVPFSVPRFSNTRNIRCPRMTDNYIIFANFELNSRFNILFLTCLVGLGTVQNYTIFNIPQLGWQCTWILWHSNTVRIKHVSLYTTAGLKYLISKDIITYHVSLLSRKDLPDYHAHSRWLHYKHFVK